MDIGLKYRYFITYDYEEVIEEKIRFEIFGDTNNEKINIIINDIQYAKRGVYYLLKIFEEKKDNEKLFIWCEVMGDLNLIIQLLLIKGGRNDLQDSVKQALMYYKESRENLKVFAEPTISYGGIYGLAYQKNFFEGLLKDFGFKGYSLSSVDKMEFIEKVLLNKESGMEYIEYSQFLDNKSILDNKITKLINKYKILKSKGEDFEDWRTVLSFIHNEILSFNYDQRDLNNIVATWKRENDMQKWMQRSINRAFIENRSEPPFFTGREIKKGGGDCDHYYRNIPICDKWKRDSNAKSYPKNIFEFIDKAYKDHYEQVKSYANDVKLAVIIIVDSREETRKKNPDMVRDCYDIKVNERDGVITALFVIQVSDTTPSQRK